MQYPVDPNLVEEVMASEKIIENNEKREDPPQEKLPEEPGEGKDPRGDSHPEEQSSCCGRKLSLKHRLVDVLDE